MIGVVAGLSRQVESDRQARLSLCEIGVIQRVRCFGRSVAPIGPKDPGAIAHAFIVAVAALVLSACTGGRSGRVILFQDDFSKRSDGWALLDTSNGQLSFSKGRLRVLPRLKAEGPAIVVNDRIPNVRDVSVEAQVSWTKPGGEEAGVMCRVVGDDRRYTFSIGSDGRFDIGKKTPKLSAILLFGEVAAIKKGDAINQLRAECFGDVLSFYVNGERVGRVKDGDLKSGSAGLRAAQLPTASETAPVRFDNLIIRPAVRVIVPKASPAAEFGSVIFTDDFSNVATKWLGTKGTSEGDGFKAAYADGRMRLLVTVLGRGISVDSGGVFTPAGRELAGLGDVSIEADVLFKSGSESAPFGPYCRRSHPVIQAYYQSFVKPNGEFVILKWRVEDGKALPHPLLGGFSPLIHRGAGGANRIRFDCVGSMLTLYVNGEKIGEAVDAEYSSGRIGRVLESGPDLPAPLEIEFDNLIVREGPAPTPR